MKRFLVLVVMLAIFCGFATLAPAEEVEIPLNIGVGPAAYLIFGPVADDQTFHYGLKLHMAAVIDERTLRENRDKIPKQYREAVGQLGEARIGFIYIPDSLFISPGLNTGIYGATWRPISFGLNILRKPRLGVDAGLIATYAYIHSTTLSSPTHFLRPGLDIKGELEIPILDVLLISLGWTSQFYIPQKVGGSIIEFGPIERSIWHIGQPFLMLHVRIPYKTSL
jgi:hypothetical protein